MTLRNDRIFVVFLASLCAAALLPVSAVGQTVRDLGAQFQRFDKNGDGKITAEEMPNAERFRRLDADGDGGITPEEAKAILMRRSPIAPEIAPKPAPRDGEIVKHADLRFAETPGVEAKFQTLDVYTAAGAKDRPVFLFVHGGSWSRGDKAMAEIMAAPIVARGYVFASANYRLIPPGKFPENAEDVAAAVAWLRRHAAEFGGDGKRLFIGGHSAGCHLVALVGTDPRYLAKHGLGLDSLSGVLALDTQMYDVEQQARESGGRLRSPYAEAFGQDPEVWRAASPSLQMKPNTGIPPFAIAYSGGVFGGRAGPRKEQAEQFAGKLRQAGASAVVVDAAEKTHGQIAREFAQPGDTVAEAVFAFFEGKENRSSTGTSSRDADDPGGLVWQKSLVFDPAKTDGSPLPVNVMNLAAHKGRLYAGMASAFEQGNYSGHSSYVFVKPGASEDWRLDADFGPGTERVGALLSARFEHDAAGKPIEGGSVDLLVAATMKLRRAGGERPLQVRIRDDATDSWRTVSLPTPPMAESNVREMIVHRDQITGADLLMVAASPEPLGIYRGSYDASAPGGILWSAEAEIAAQGRRDGASKWFGMAVVNGVLLASNTRDIYRRVDGPKPRWVKVAEFGFAGDIGNTEIRGLTAVPNPTEATGWPEQEVLFFTSRMKLWRMRVPKSPEVEHTRQVEFEMVPYLTERMGREVVFAEAAFNRLPAFQPPGTAKPVWPVGFQLVYGVPGKRPTQRDPSSYELTHEAFYFLRDERGQYTMHTIVDPADAARRLFLARDFASSPFPGEANVLYAGGFNGSYFKGSLGTAWVYRGESGATGRTAAQEPRQDAGTMAGAPGKASEFTDFHFRRDFVPGSKDAQGNDLSGTELNAIVEHGGKLWAAMSYIPERDQRGNRESLGPKILVKETAASPWKLDFNLGPDYLRAGVMRSVSFTTDCRGNRLTSPMSVLMVGDWRLAEPKNSGIWARDDATGRWHRSVLTAQIERADGREVPETRVIFDHVDLVTGVHHIFAGGSSGSLFRGAYDGTVPGGVVWETAPEIEGRRKRFMCAAVANGVAYTPVPPDSGNPEPRNGGLFRRIDGLQPRWEWIYEWPRPDNLEAGDRAYPLGMRGLTAVPDPLRTGKESLLGGREIPGVVERIDPADGHKVTLELDVAAFLQRLWGGPPIRHVTISYNEITPATHPDTGERVHLLGLWANHPDRTRPDLRNSAWYLVRHGDLTYSLGRVFDPDDSALDPRYGLHGLRTICASPFPEDSGRVWYFGGFDQTGRMWGNQAWIYKATLQEKP